MGVLDGKVLIVTGASSGIGEATAILAAQEGGKVVLAARREDEGESVAESIRKSGGDALFVKTDVAHEDEVAHLISTTVEKYGRLDCAFNNAGIHVRSPDEWENKDVEVFDEINDVNLRGVWLCMKYQIRQMLKNGGGSIVNNSSLAGLTAAPAGVEIYTATKHGVIGLTKNAGRNYGRSGIRVNAVCPGIIETALVSGMPEAGRKRFTEHIPMNRFGRSSEIAEAAVWLCSDKSSYVTSTTLTIDGGIVEQFALMPPLED